MKLLALKEIPDSVVMIAAGQTFIEPNPEQAQYWLNSGFAKSAEPVPLTVVAPSVNSRGWNGLMWDGATVCIMASGPSMSEEQAAAVRVWAAGSMRRTIAVNTTFRLAPWADVLYACDGRWWDAYHTEVAAKSSSQFWSQDPEAKKYSEMHLVKSDRKDGLGKTPGVIHQGMSSGYQAMNLAYQAGTKKIFLLGFDCHAGDDKQSHWHGDHPSPLNNSNPYTGWIKKLETISVDLADAGVEVINLTPGSATKSFPMQDWREALA